MTKTQPPKEECDQMDMSAKETMEKIMEEFDKGFCAKRCHGDDSVKDFLRSACVRFAESCVPSKNNNAVLASMGVTWLKSGYHACRTQILSNIASVGEEVKTIKEE